MEQYTSGKRPQRLKKELDINLRDLWQLTISHWHWYLLSVIICMLLASYYILKTPKVYSRKAYIEVKEDDAKRGSSIMKRISSAADFGMIDNSSNANNQVYNFMMPVLALETTQRLHLDYEYYADGLFQNKTLYGTTLPIKASVEGLDDKTTLAFTIDITPSGTFTLSKFARDTEKYNDQEVTGKLGQSVKTPIGNITITKTPDYNIKKNSRIHVRRNSLYAVQNSINNRLKASLVNKLATILELSFTDVCPQRAEDIINTIILVNNENWIKDKNQITVSTNQFINERLKVIELELGGVDNDISSYMSQNLITDNKAAATLFLNESTEASNKILELNNQLYMIRHVRTYLQNGGNDQLLPENSGIKDASLEKAINDYNQFVLRRKNLIANSSEANPLIQKLDENINDIRHSIIVGLDNQNTLINSQIKALTGSVSANTSKISNAPRQQKYILSVERQQKVKEALYLFLLEKREENELSQAFTAYNTRVANPPMGSNIPVSPKPMLIFIIAFMLGLTIPSIFIYIIEMMNTKVRGRKDIESLTAPYIGEIPFFAVKKLSWWQKKLRIKPESLADVNKKNVKILVSPGNDNMINEAFRVVRTNLSYMHPNKDQGLVVMVTSCNPGSGKSFCTANLAASFAIAGKKILMIDLDLRRASLSALVNSPKEGISNYIAGFATECHETGIKDLDGLSIIPSGILPPNPAELLLNPRVKEFIDSKRSEYDYIFLDCPPVQIVADATIVSKYADMTIFVIRAELLERAMLPTIESYYNDKSYPNLTVLLNGSSVSRGRYSYQYGYHNKSYGGYGK